MDVVAAVPVFPSPDSKVGNRGASCFFSQIDSHKWAAEGVWRGKCLECCCEPFTLAGFFCRDLPVDYYMKAE